MKIRSGFVSNSSSTSFLIITKGKLKKKDLRDLMGVKLGSPLTPLFDQLYDDLLESVEAEIDLDKSQTQSQWEMAIGRRSDRLSSRMISKLESNKGKGTTAYFGHLDSETSNVQTFFCMDCFEEENDKIYVNALENAW
jgi:hypothetical protein